MSKAVLLLQVCLLLLLAPCVAADSRNTSLCAPVDGTNCNQNDLSDGGVVASHDACCAACIAFGPSCVAWTFNKGSDQHCWLKKNCDGKVSDPSCISGYGTRPPTPAPSPPPPLPPAPKAATSYQRGVSLGGWLVMEGWMFDQFQTPAENDFIRTNRKKGGDAYALQSQVNHWGGYIPDAALDAMRALGVTHVRIPVGYWISEAPVSGVAWSSSRPRNATLTNRDVGFQHEGYVTGGIVHLEALLMKLKERGMRALIDVHAMPGGSSKCQSYGGMQVVDPNFWTASVGDTIAACGGAGPYTSTRPRSALTPMTEGEGGAAVVTKTTWMEVGVTAVTVLAEWIVALEKNASLAGVVSGLEVVNEPGLGFTSALLPAIKTYHLTIVPLVQRIFREGNIAVNCTVNFIGPNDAGMGSWLRKQVDAHVFDGRSLVVDFHNYYNWDAPIKTFASAMARVCATKSGAEADWSQYADANLSTLIGEWSNAIAQNSHATSDIDDATQRAAMSKLWADQVSLFESVPGGRTAGQFYWTIRQGSGWDPRPALNSTAAATSSSRSTTTNRPDVHTMEEREVQKESKVYVKHQLVGTAWNHSLTTFGTRNWNLGELYRVGVVKPMDELAITGLCECDGCSGN